MPGRVLTTAQAEADAKRMLAIINSISQQFTQLNATGQTLSDPSNWDGQYAAQFRADWPGVVSTLNKMSGDLTQLQSSVSRVLQDIQQSGGGL
jgi:uncharacterized protein YukE